MRTVSHPHLALALLGAVAIAVVLFMQPYLRALRGEVATSIASCTDLQNINNDLAGDYILTSNIDCSGIANFVPIGTSGTSFTGSLDGDDYVISNLTINRPETDDVGLFGYIDSANIQDVGLANVSISGASQVGALVGNSLVSTVTRSYVISGNITGVFYVGALVGSNSSLSTVSDSFSLASVTNTDGGGGIVGGLVGLNNSADVIRSYAAGVVTANATDVGGLVGSSDADSSIVDSFAIGGVTGLGLIGGLLGFTTDTTITNSYWNNHVGNPDECYSGGDTGCTAISDNEPYFFDSSNAPMSSWDFDTVWEENENGTPTLRVGDAVVEPSITGYLRAANGTTPLTSKDVSVSLNGGAKAGSGTTDAGGQFTISSGISGMTGGTILTLYVDNETQKAVTVTMGTGGTLTGVNLYVDHLIIGGGEDAVSITNNVLAIADNNRDFDLLQIFEVLGDSLFVKHRKKLIIDSSASYTLGGQMFTGSGITINGTLSMGSYTGSLVGDWNLSGGTFNAGTSTINFVGSGQSIMGASTFYGFQKISQEQDLTLLDSAGSFVDADISIGSDGLPVMSYYYQASGDLKVLKCGNESCTQNNITTTVDSAGDVGVSNSIVIAPDGLPVIGYYDSTNGDLKILKCGNGTCSSGNTTTTVDSTGDIGYYPFITIGSDGLPILAYQYLSSFDLKVLKCGNSTCSSGNTITTVDSTGNVGDTPSIAIGTDGLPVIAHFDATNVELEIIKCGNLSCSAGNTKTVADTNGNVGLFASIVIAPDGLPVVSYKDQTNPNRNLKVLKCGNAACTSGNTVSAVDTVGDVGGFTSIAIAPDGFPIISHYDQTNEDLKVVKCGNATCTSSNTITSPDTTGAVGAYTSVTIAPDGLPIISYSDATNSSLKVIKCANISCTTTSRAGSLTFQSSAEQTVSNNLTLQGTGSAILAVRASTSDVAAQLSLNEAGSQTIDHVDVKDNDASGEQQLQCYQVAEMCVNSGNNSNWLFLNNTPNISNCEELQAMSADLDGDYVLTQNIDCSDTVNWNGGLGFDPIGTLANPFTGSLDGSGFLILDLTINRPSTDYVGLIGYGNFVGALQNIGLYNVNIVGQEHVGSIAGYIQRSNNMQRLHAIGVVEGNGDYVGGLVGNSFFVTYSNCHTDVTVSTSGDYAGGIVGQNTEDFGGTGEIEDCYSVGNVIGNQYVGGITGFNGSLLTNVFSRSGIFGSSNVGGIAGYTFETNPFSITNAHWFDIAEDGADDCYEGGNTNCTIRAAVADFYDPTNEPLASWDFNTTWHNFSSKYPRLNVLRQEINTCQQLQSISGSLMADFILTQDIDCSDTINWNSGAGFDPIGELNPRFTGIFDGSGYTIFDLHINRPLETRNGLFRATNYSIIQNVTLMNAYVEGGSSVGILGSDVSGDITSVSVTGTASGSTYVGGITSSFSLGSMSGSTMSGTVTASGDYAGGLTATTDTGNHIENSYSTATVSGDDTVGGAVGRAYNGSLTIINVYSTGNVTGTNNVGGLVGQASQENVYDSYATGDVTGNGYVGGLIGRLNAYSALSGSYATGTVSAAGTAGGLVGSMTANTSIYKSYASGNVGEGGTIGGLVGYAEGGTIDNAYATGNVGTGGTDDVGGFIGFNAGADITNAYAIGNVVGTNYLGGFAGENDSGSITDAFSAGSVTGDSVVGGFLSQPGAIGTIDSIYWLNQPGDTAGDCYNGGNTNCTAASALSAFYGSTNEPMASWDFDTIWTSNECDYPFLTGVTQEEATECEEEEGVAVSPYCGDGQVQGGEQCDRGPLNVPLSFANLADEDIDEEAVAVLIRSNCLETCRYAQCSDGIDNDGDGLKDATSPKDGQGNTVSVYDVTLETSDPGCLVGQAITGNQAAPYLQGRNGEWNACVYPTPYQEYGFLTQTGSSSIAAIDTELGGTTKRGASSSGFRIFASLFRGIFGWFMPADSSRNIALRGQAQGGSSSSLSATWYYEVNGNYVTSLSSSSAAATYRCIATGDRAELGARCDLRAGLDHCAQTGSTLRCTGPVKALGGVCVSRSDCANAYDANGVLRGNDELDMDVFCARTVAEAQAICCTNATVYSNGSSSSSVPAQYRCGLPRYGNASSANAALIPNCAGGISTLNAKPLTCGNGVVEGREQCDDGNTEDYDACSNICTNGSIQRTFSFLDQYPANGALLLPEVWSGAIMYESQLFETGTGHTADFNETLIVDANDAEYIITLFNYYFSCGDGVLDLDDGEQCDDGNNADGDGCSIFCQADTGSGVTLPASGSGSSSSSSSSGAVISGSGSSSSPISSTSSFSSASSASSVTSVSSASSVTSTSSATSVSSTSSIASSSASVLAETQAVNPLFCGDGILSAPAEECEVGFSCTSSGDICNQVTCLCTPKNVPICGDGLINQQSEQCEQGISCSGEFDTCNAFSCACEPPPICGDGELNVEGEQCERGIACPEGQTCNPNSCGCIVPVCGDGLVNQPSEECDAGTDNSNAVGSSCRTDCTLGTANPVGFCGDGLINRPNEECEKGIACGSSSDVCNQFSCQCTPGEVPICGDGILNRDSEQCEAGISCTGQFDTCNGFSCACEPPPICGDGLLNQSFERCEVGVSCPSGQSCDPNSCGCVTPVCGDGVVNQNSEECDDGNLNDNDGCNALCRSDSLWFTVALSCGNGLLEAGEQCDDGNNVAGDGCSALCQSERLVSPTIQQIACGDGVVDVGEECDDGNELNGDGCSASCRTEQGLPNETLPANVIELPLTVGGGNGGLPDLIGRQGTGTSVHSGAPSYPPETPSSGPASLAIMLAGGIAGLLWQRKRQTRA